MGMIDRYKKRGGFVQLVNLIETTGSEKREKFLKMIAEESPVWENAIKQKMLNMDRMSNWNVPFLMEFLPQVPMMAIAFAIAPLSEEKQKHFISALSFGDRKKVEDVLKESKPGAAEVSSAQIKVINELRNMVAMGKLKLDKCDPELAIPEDYEDYLASQPSGKFSGGPISIPTPAAPEAKKTSSGPSPAGAPAAAASGPTHAVDHGNSHQLTEEVNVLRKKLVALTQENMRLNKENEEFKSRLDAVRTALKAS